MLSEEVVQTELVIPKCYRRLGLRRLRRHLDCSINAEEPEEGGTLNVGNVVADELPNVGSSRTVAASAGDSIVISGLLTESVDGC